MAVSSPVFRPSRDPNSTLIPSQYRTLDRIYLLKVKQDGSTTLKILDISQKCLYKKSLSAEELGAFSIQHIAKTSLRPLLETLVQKQLLPPEHYPTSNKSISPEECKQTAAQAIQQYKPRVIAEHREIEGFSCPLTLEVFQEPVVDNHGHTFEKSAIEEHRKNSNLCPINRQPITSLIPNLLVRQTIESYQQQEPIPSFSLFKKENPKLAATNLQSAQTYLEEGEYLDAFDSYTKAFQYTKDWHHYIELPLLFKKMEQPEKVILAYLYLAHYQLQDRKIQEAIQTLETCQQEQVAPRQIDLFLIQLYQLNNQPEKSLQLTRKTAQALSSEHPEQAIALYRQILNQNPQQFELYLPLSHLLKSPQEKAHTLLKGACHALEVADHQTAQYLCEQAKKHSVTSFIDGLLSLELLEKPALKQELILLATAYEQKKLPHQVLRAYKMLFQLEEKAEYCEKIVASYDTLQKVEQQTPWYTRWLSLLMQQEDWPAAERVAQAALERTSEKISLYQTLETIYTHWQGNRLGDLWTKLGQAQFKNDQLEAAEKTYRKAYQRFHQVDHAIALAETLSRQGNVPQSVQMYYEASSLALLDGRLEKLDQCIRQIKESDPRLEYLDTSQRIQLMTQKTLIELYQKLEQSEQKLQESYQNQERLSKELQETREEIRLLKEKTPKEKVNSSAISNNNSARSHSNLGSTSSQAILSPVNAPPLPAIAFGAEKWKQYFGDVGVEPPLPSNIQEILSSPCPIWTHKRVEETHLLVLVPRTVNGEPLTLRSLGKLVRAPKRGGHATQYSYFSDEAINRCGDVTIQESYWILMMKDILPNSRYKIREEHTQMLSKYHHKYHYRMPTVLEASIAIFMEYVSSGIRLYPDAPLTYMRCQEQVGNYSLVIGGFATGGPVVSSYVWSSYCGVGGRWKF